ncbi:MAG: efflux RND transporter periplasmic adaptor subunit, partial [Bacteroidia bacterium]|nr:efflux RND transporter periplasmic adaptor subunit [Bacteroidia bacterium]
EYETENVIETNIIKKSVATGAVVPRKEIEIKPKVSGIIDQIYIEPGQMVKRGDLIARIKITPNMVNLNNAESRVNRSKINFNNVKIEYDRNLKLKQDEVISESEFKQFELNFNSAKEEMEAAQNNLDLIKKGSTKASGKSSNTLIRSTISGMVLDVPIEEGNSVIESNTFNDGTTVAFVADMGEMIFEGKVDESEVGKLKPGMDLILTIGAIDEEKFHADLEYISPKGVTENGAIQFEIRAKVVLDEGNFIRAGYSANADIVLDRKDSVMAVPENLVQFAEDSVFVEVRTGDQEFEKRLIKTGISDGINIEILEGLSKDDEIKQPNTELEDANRRG